MKSCWIRAVNPLGGLKKCRDTGTHVNIKAEAGVTQPNPRHTRGF